MPNELRSQNDVPASAETTPEQLAGLRVSPEVGQAVVKESAKVPNGPEKYDPELYVLGIRPSITGAEGKEAFTIMAVARQGVTAPSQLLGVIEVGRDASKPEFDEKMKRVFLP
jgi:hypothetical protein